MVFDGFDAFDWTINRTLFKRASNDLPILKFQMDSEMDFRKIKGTGKASNHSISRPLEFDSEFRTSIAKKFSLLIYNQLDGKGSPFGRLAYSKDLPI